MTKTILIIFYLCILTGCATHYWKKESWAKTNFAEAHNDCRVKMKIAIGNQQGSYDWGFQSRQDEFMKECMAGQGFTYAKKQE